MEHPAPSSSVSGLNRLGISASGPLPTRSTGPAGVEDDEVDAVDRVQGVGHLAFSLSVKVVTQYQRGVLFRLGKVVGVKEPGLALIIPVIDRLVRVSLRIVTMPIQSKGIITRDDVSVDISAVAYFRVADPLKSVIAHRETSTPRSTKIA